jgi:hypothetical protein
MNEDIGQKRARKGGEFGANGEFYEGGKFIATKDNAKSAPRRWEPTAEERAAYEARKAAEADRAARIAAWIAERRVRFSDLIESFTAYPAGATYLSREEWGYAIENGHAGFAADLGRQLRNSGSLSERQAYHAAKLFLGRQTKKNASAFDALVDALVEDFAD